MSERFAFCVGDRVRLSLWPPDQYITVIGIGETQIFGRVSWPAEMYEQTFSKTGKGEWQLYSDVLQSDSLWVVAKNDGTIHCVYWSEPELEREYPLYPYGSTIWKVSLDGAERIK